MHKSEPKLGKKPKNTQLLPRDVAIFVGKPSKAKENTAVERTNSKGQLPNQTKKRKKAGSTQKTAQFVPKSRLLQKDENSQAGGVRQITKKAPPTKGKALTLCGTGRVRRGLIVPQD